MWAGDSGSHGIKVTMGFDFLILTVRTDKFLMGGCPQLSSHLFALHNDDCELNDSCGEVAPQITISWLELCFLKFQIRIYYAGFE